MTKRIHSLADLHLSMSTKLLNRQSSAREENDKMQTKRRKKRNFSKAEMGVLFTHIHSNKKIIKKCDDSKVLHRIKK